MKKIAINGFGRIGRMAMRSLLKRNLPLDVVAINDLTDTKTLAHLFQFDSTFGRFEGEVSSDENSITIEGKKIAVFSERDPANLPWKKYAVETVLECTGFFRHRHSAQKHIDAGAKHVIISAPAKGEIDGTFVVGVNDDKFTPDTQRIISNASCTTNCLAPVAKVLDSAFGIETGLMTTIHSFTGDQRLLDAPHSDLRRARAATRSLIPTSTGAAEAVALVLPKLSGKLSGMAIRVPTENVSVVDLTVQLRKRVSAKEVNAALEGASKNDLAGILGFETRPLVSHDFLGNSHSAIVDAKSTIANENMAKVVAWYDNEWGYANRLCDLSLQTK